MRRLRRCGVLATVGRRRYTGNRLRGGFAGSKILEVHGKRMLDNDLPPGLKTRLHQNDLKIIDTAHQFGLALPGTAPVAQHLNALTGSGTVSANQARS